MKKILPFLMLLFVSSCQKEEEKAPLPVKSCEFVVCENGGVCENGECKCPINYTGSDCSEQKTPKSIGLREITLKDFPMTRNIGPMLNMPWDSWGGEPDIIVVLEYYDGTLRPLHSFSYDILHDADTASMPGIYIGDGYISFKNVTDKYYLAFYDDDSLDGGGREFMGRQGFKVYSKNNGFPESINVRGLNGFEFELKFGSYTF